MSNARTAILGLSLPTRAILWLLEGGIALSISAYLTYRYYPPCAQALSNSLNIQAGGFLVTLVVVAIVFPFALALMSALVLFAAGFVPRQARMAFDVLAMTIVASALVIPTVQEAVQTRSLPQPSVTSILPVASGPLDTAPPPLKLQRIPLGAEVRNDGPEPLDVGVLFIGVNDNRRSYCAGNPLSMPKKDRYRIAAGAIVTYMSGNCQYGQVALTVWDVTGRRLYQTSAASTPDLVK